MAQPLIDLAKALRIADHLKEEINQHIAIGAARKFLRDDNLAKTRAGLLADMGVVPFLVQYIKSTEYYNERTNERFYLQRPPGYYNLTRTEYYTNREKALLLLLSILKKNRDKIPEIVDVNLVKTLVAKLREPHFAFCAASALAIIAEHSEELRQMIRRHGFMEAILVAADNCLAQEDFTPYTRLLSKLFTMQTDHLSLYCFAETEKGGLIWMILSVVHTMFKREGFDDSPESFETVLPLVEYMLARSDEDSLECTIVCPLLIDFFRHPMQEKVSLVLTYSLIPFVVELMESRNGDTVTGVIACVASLAGSSPQLTDELFFSGVVQKLAKVTNDGRNDEGVCLALRELVRNGGSTVMSSIDDPLLNWVRNKLLSPIRNLRLAACTALVCMIHAEDAVPGRVQVKLGTVTGVLGGFLDDQCTQSEVEAVLTHLAIVMDITDKHPSALDDSMKTQRIRCIRKLKQCTQHNLYARERVRALDNSLAS